MNRPKMARVVYRNPHFSIGNKAFAGRREKALCQDDEHKPYIRGRRTLHHLPDTYDTKWLKRYKGWKHRARKRKQWMPHWMNHSEWNWIRDVKDWWWSENIGKLSNDRTEVPKPVNQWIGRWWR